ncbi:MAG: alpha/beta fold hydrolase [Bacteroidota bacterium]
MELHASSRGQGPPLVILHGLLGSGDNWASFARALADAYRVITCDARNHGRSPHTAVMNYGAMALDLEILLDRFGLPWAHLLGHSMGGKTAMQFAVTRPHRVGRLIVVDIGPGSYGRRHDPLLDALSGLDLGRCATRASIDRALAERIPEPAVRQFLLKNVGRTEAGGFGWRPNLKVLQGAYEELLGGLPPGSRCLRPALFVRGGMSDHIGSGERGRIRRIFPHAAVLTIRKAGHWVQRDAPAELEQAVRAFLRLNGASPAPSAQPSPPLQPAGSPPSG